MTRLVDLSMPVHADMLTFPRVPAPSLLLYESWTEFAERILVAVDVRGGHAMVKGWREEGPPVEEVIPALNDAGTPRYLVTAIARDGTLDGPDLRLYRQVLGLTDRPIIASGGVRSADDIWALRDAGCEAAVTGKALYEKTLKLSQVIRG